MPWNLTVGATVALIMMSGDGARVASELVSREAAEVFATLLRYVRRRIEQGLHGQSPQVPAIGPPIDPSKRRPT